MPKYIVRCYYQYVGRVEVEADSVEEAFNKGYDICDKMKTEELDYVDYIDSEVEEADGFIHEF